MHLEADIMNTFTANSSPAHQVAQIELQEEDRCQK